ncbi:hypothetical protein BKI52_27145 [marine bacterium AO1-C]|nr:hypothetical protein BKI52_27145 [marine bacterium AO1-C]
MKKVFENKFVVMYLDEENKLLNDVWAKTSANLSTQQFKEIMYEWRDLVITNQVKLALLDTREMKFMIDPDLQHWIATEINAPAQQHGLIKVANLLPPSVFEQVSIQQTLDEMKAVNDFTSKVFKDESEAKSWLFS